MNINIRIPLHLKESKQDIEKTFKQEALKIAKKLPYFEYFNIVTKLVKSQSMQQVTLEDVRNDLMSTLPEETTTIDIYMTDHDVRNFNYIKTNDKRLGMISNIQDFSSARANELLSFLILKILNITPNKSLFDTASSNNIDLSLPEDFKNELELFNMREIDAKRKVIILNLASTGTLTDQSFAIQTKFIDETSQINKYEYPVVAEYYRQTEFPLLFKFAVFFAFYTPFISRMLTLIYNVIKFKIRGKI